MADARVSILLDVKSRLANLDRAVGSFKSLATQVAGLAAGYVSVRAALRGGRDILEYGAELEHLRSRTGIAVSSQVILQQALKDNGIKADVAEKSIAKMQKTLVDAAEGRGTGLYALERLNLSVDDLARLSPQERFMLIGEAIAGIEDPAIRSASAMDLFGRSGVELVTLFRAGDLEDAAASLGQMPAILERNAAQFERVDTLLGRLPNKSRQFFAGVADQVIGSVLPALEEVDDFDFSGIGQTVGAVIAEGIESIEEGRAVEFLGLFLKAGFETGLNQVVPFLTETLGEVITWLFSEHFLTTWMASSASAGRYLAEALTVPLSAINLMLVDGLKRLLSSLDGILPNSFGKRMERQIHSAKNQLVVEQKKLNELLVSRGTSLPGGYGEANEQGIVRYNPELFADEHVQKQLAHINRLQTQIDGLTQTLRTYNGEFTAEERYSLVTANMGQIHSLLAEIEEGWQKATKAEMAGVDEVEEQTENQRTALEQLNALLQERIRLRQEDASIPASTTATTEEGGGDQLQVTTFQSRALERFKAFSDKAGDYSVEIWESAKAAAMDYLTSVGTVGQQVYGTVLQVGRGIASGLSQSLMGLFSGTMRLGEATRTFFVSIGTSIVQAFSQMIANWIVQRMMAFALNQSLNAAEVAGEATKEGAKTAISAGGAGTRMGIKAGETATQIGLTTTEVAAHIAGEGAKTGTTLGGTLARGAMRVGETLFEVGQIGIRVLTFILGEGSKTAATLLQFGLRLPIIIAESFANVIKAAVQAMSALAGIPVVGPALAAGAAAAMLGLGIGLISQIGGFSEGGFTGWGDALAPAGIVHKKEFVMPADVVTRHGPGYFYNLLHSLRTDRPMPVGVHPRTTRVKPTQFLLVDSRDQVERLRHNPRFTSTVIEIGGRNAGEFARTL